MSDGDAPDACAAGIASREFRDAIRRFVARRVKNPDVVDDLAQEVFLRMHEHAQELRDAQAIGPWAYRIAHRVVIDHLRRQRKLLPLDEAAAGALAQEDASEANINAEVASWLRPMMGLLPPEYAEALVLTDLDGLTQRELAERLGISVSGVKSRVQRARGLLEERLRDCCNFESDARGNLLDAGLRARVDAPRGKPGS